MRTFLTVFKLDPSPLSSSSYPLLCLHSKILLLKSFGFCVKVHRPHFGPWPAFTYCPLWPWTPWTPVTQTPEPPFFSPALLGFHPYSPRLECPSRNVSAHLLVKVRHKHCPEALTNPHPQTDLSFFLRPHSILFLLIAHFPNLLKALT